MDCFDALQLVSIGAFSIGFPYHYWNKYESSSTKSNDEYYVEAKYCNFKVEIMHYKHITKKQYDNEVRKKAKIYMHTNAIKSIPTAGKDNAYYKIAEDATISIEHVISVILYTDYSALSAHFSSTFRKAGFFEPLNVSKERNGKYAYFSKFLMETVQVYGQNGKYGTLSGPFYSGMSRIMKMPQFQIFLSSPTSTSVHLEVAMKFSGGEGIIIEFDNKTHGILKSEYTKGFDVSYISRYPEEDERYLNIH